MINIKVFCTSLKYLKIIDKLPHYIIPLGLGKNEFPTHWLDEKKGKNISNLNKHYGELTGIYWIWKNQTQKMNDEDFIGNCHYRKLWLNNNYVKKQKHSFASLEKNLLDVSKLDFQKFDCIQVQPISFKNKNLLDDFKEIHESSILLKCADFLDDNTKNLFLNHVYGKKLFPLNMFITKVKNFKNYCEIIFPWLEKCYNLCEQKKILLNYNTRLPAFLAERFTSFWFSQYSKKITLSYARLGKVFLSNNINSFFNPIKLPFTFRMYPTLHRY